MLFKSKPEEKPTKRIGRKAEKINLVNKISVGCWSALGVEENEVLPTKKKTKNGVYPTSFSRMKVRFGCSLHG